MVNLSQIELANEEDKKYHIDDWARLFKATTWEEIHMLAAKDDYINEAAETIFQLSADEQIRERCFAREEYYREIRTYKKLIAEKDALLEKTISEKDSVLSEKDAVIQELSAELEKLRTKTGR